MEAIKNYTDKDEIRTHAGKPIGLDSWIFVELRKMEAIKNYANKDEIQTHTGKAHWIRQSNATLSYLMLETVEYL